MIKSNFRIILTLITLYSAYPLTLAAEDRVQDVQARSDFLYRVNLGRADDVRLMISEGASANQANGEGVPALSLAADRTDEESVNVMRALLENGANINARDRKGQTALFHAAQVGNIPGINFLLEQGIDMYAIDNSGNVARSVAHLEGQEDSIKAMDDFVLRTTAEIKQDYIDQKNEVMQQKLDYHRKRAEALLSPASADGATANMEDILNTPVDPSKIPAPPQAFSAKKKAMIDMFKSVKKTDVLTTTTNDITHGAKPQAVKLQGAADEQDPFFTGARDPDDPDGDGITRKEELKDTIYQMAYNVCAFQYWYYCSSAKQSTDIDDEEVIVAIESRKNNAEKLQAELISEYKMSPKQVGMISVTVQKRIYLELDNMASNRDRHEKGVGKLDDMRERCELLARHWGAQMPIRRKGGGKKGGLRGKAASNNSAGRATSGGGEAAGMPASREEMMKMMKSKMKKRKARGK